MNRHGSSQETFWSFFFSPVRDERGEVVALLCVTNEQTKRIRTEEAHVARAAEMTAEITQGRTDLAKAEDQLRQSQKLEAIGQLTGGVAHDFNNLLTVIRGSVDLLRRDDLTPERRVRYIDAIGETADRAAKLTGQLLAFARRQALKPETFDAGASVAEIRRHRPHADRLPHRGGDPDPGRAGIRARRPQPARHGHRQHGGQRSRRDERRRAPHYFNGPRIGHSGDPGARGGGRRLRGGDAHRHRHGHSRPTRSAASSSRSSRPRGWAREPVSA